METKKQVRGALVAKKCESCGGDMTARQADINRGWGKFCSKSCKGKKPESAVVPPRPTVTEAIVAAAAKALVNQKYFPLDSAGVDAAEAERDIIACYEYRMDGYQLAKALDDDRSWRIDCGIIDDLDGMEGMVDDEVKAAQRAWQAKFDIQPPFPLGTEITEGLITGICDRYPASYLVKRPGYSETMRLILKFEDAKLPAKEQS